MTPDSAGPELQCDVQRLLGRCMLRLQQFEKLLKTLLTHHELRGTVDDLQARLDARGDSFAGKSLGMLVAEFFGSYVVVAGGANDRPQIEDGGVPTDRVSMAMRFRIEMSEDRRSDVMAAVKDLVVMRNDLVHHPIEKFNLWSEDGCVAASEHLKACYERTDRHVADVQAMARALQEALNGHAADGWARLDKAKAWISVRHPEQTPEKYGCRSWPQVLHDSRCFNLVYRTGDDVRRVGWYRTRWRSR